MEDKEHELVREEDCWPRCRCGWMPDCGLHSRNTVGVFAVEKHVLQANARRSTVASGRWVPKPEIQAERLRIADMLRTAMATPVQGQFNWGGFIGRLVDELRAGAPECRCGHRWLNGSPEGQVIDYERECPVHGDVVKTVEDRDVAWLRRRVESKREWLSEHAENGVTVWLESLIRGMEARDGD